MARQFKCEVWDALDVSYDTFVQTSRSRHASAAASLQKVYDAGHIYKGSYRLVLRRVRDVQKRRN